jgi:dihydroorotate dehydrogenase electron transfer subunit
VLTLAQVRRENDEMVTLFFPVPEAADAAARGLDLSAFVPGRFFMVWIPRLDEKPYALSYLDAERLAITVQKRGPFSTRLFELKPGAKVGLRGPFGRGFWDIEKHAGSSRVALIGGGCGTAVLAPLARMLPGATLVEGARSARVVLRLEGIERQVLFTDDGSAGRQGFPTAWLEEQAGGVDMIYTCGPEAMIYAVVAACLRAGIACQASLERYMKCGVGVCGQCDCDGRLVCRDGPTFGAEELADMPSFGRARRDKTGRRIELTIAAQCPSGPIQPVPKKQL